MLLVYNMVTELFYPNLKIIQPAKGQDNKVRRNKTEYKLIWKFENPYIIV